MTKEDSIAEDVEKMPGEADDGEHYLDLVVLTPTGLRVDIPMISVNEPVSIIKQSLTDFRETAFYTNFHLTILNDESGIVLNDFIEIGNYPLESGSVVVMNFDDYDVKRARIHLKRVREFILAPPTSRGSNQVSSVKTNAGSQQKKANKQNDKRAAPGKAASKPNDLHQVSGEEKVSDMTESERADRQMARDLLPAFESIISGSNFSMDKFFKEVLFRTGSAPNANGSSLQQPVKLPSDCVKSLAMSGWNPPPLDRKMQGDLLYVEAVVDEGTLHITCVAGGFYVSRSSRHYFDPRPAANSFYSHDLFSLLLQASASFASTWASSSSVAIVESKPGSVGTLDLFASLFSQGRGDFVSLQPQWNASPADLVNITANSKVPSHTYEVSRTQDDLLDGFGVEEKGVQREWNEEIQAIRSLSVSNLNEKILKSRLIYKVITEFSEACKVLVLAIADGHIAPLNMSDTEVNFVYVYNGIFISRAVDSKDTFKLCKGDEANRKSASHDMNNQKLIQSLEFDEVSSVLCAIVDFRGDRYIGQTIIPGILSNSKNAARLMYGILEPGKRITVKKDAHAALKKIYEKLYIYENEILANPLLPTTDETVVDIPESAPETTNQGILGRLDAEQASPIRVDDLDELSPLDCITTSHVGPIEGKILEGSDGRLYALEILRLTPRDSNYLKAPHGTGKIASELLELTDEDATTAYLLRHELISQYIDHHVINLRNAYLQSAVKQYKTLVDEQKSSAEVKPSDGLTNEENKVVGQEENLSGENVDLSNFRLTQQQIDECNAISAKDLGLVIDPDCFFEISPVESETAKDAKKNSEETARKLATFLFDTILPAFTKQVRQGELLPLDCDNMVQLMHRFGINVRYLGQLGNLARDQETEDLLNSLMGKQRIQMMPYYWLEFLETEMIARTFKVVLYSLLRSNTNVSRASASTIASMLNHVFGVVESTVINSPPIVLSKTAPINSSKSSKKKKSKGGANDTTVSSDNKGLLGTTIPDLSTDLASSRDEVLKSIVDTLIAKFSYAPSLLEIKINPDETSSNADHEVEGKQKNPVKVPTYDISGSLAFVGSRINKASLLRRICQQAGLRVITKDYNFNSAKPFTPSDIIALVPKVKTCEPPNLLENSVDLLERAKEQLQEKNIAVAFEMAQEASNIAQQIVGPLHKNSLRAIEVLTTTLLSNGDIQAAIGLIVKSLVVGVQLYGLDCPETLTCHSQLSVYFSEMKNYVAAIQHGLTALYLAHLLGGASHPEFSAMLLQLSQICRAINEDEYALQLILLARNRLTDIYKQSMVGETLAEIYMRTGRLDEALMEQRHCSKIISDIAGDDTTKAKASKERLNSYLRAVTQRNVNQAKERQAAEALQKDLEWIDTGVKKLSGPGGKAKKSSGKSRK